jgi:hypothetical protein
VGVEQEAIQPRASQIAVADDISGQELNSIFRGHVPFTPTLDRVMRVFQLLSDVLLHVADFASLAGGHTSYALCQSISKQLTAHRAFPF